MSATIQIIGYDLPDFFAELKKSLIPELREQLSKDFQPKEEYLTRSEVCKLLKIDLSSLHRWRKEGKILVMVGRKFRPFFMLSFKNLVGISSSKND